MPPLDDPLISRRHPGADPRDRLITLEEIAGTAAPRGYAALRIEPAPDGAPPAAWLTRLRVGAADRGHGLGRRLLREAADEARRAGAVRLSADLGDVSGGAAGDAAGWLLAAGFTPDTHRAGVLRLAL